MALSKDAFQNYLAQWADDMQGEVQALESWADNKADTNPNFDYSTAKADLETARSNLVSSTATVKAL